MIYVPPDLQLAAVTLKEAAKDLAVETIKLAKLAIILFLEIMFLPIYITIETVIDYTKLLKNKVDFYRKNTLSYWKKTLYNFQKQHNIDKEFHLSVHLEFMKTNCPKMLKALRTMLDNTKKSSEYKRERYTFLKHTIDLFAVTGIDKDDDDYLHETFEDYFSDGDVVIDDWYLIQYLAKKVLTTVDIPQSTGITKHLHYPEGTDIESVINSYTEELSTDTQQKDKWLSYMQYQKLLYILENKEKYAPLQKMLDHAKVYRRITLLTFFSPDLDWQEICEYISSEMLPTRDGLLLFNDQKNIQARIGTKEHLQEILASLRSAMQPTRDRILSFEEHINNIQAKIDSNEQV